MSLLKRALALMLIATALIVIMAPRPAAAQGTFYAEEPKDGRIYVFYFMKSYAEWKQGGEMGKSITRVGAGPNGETLVFDSNEAINLYNYKHGLPLETFVE